jgi:hypothetical protein
MMRSSEAKKLASYRMVESNTTFAASVGGLRIVDLRERINFDPFAIGVRLGDIGGAVAFQVRAQ